MKKKQMKEFMESVIADLEREGRYSTAHVYRCALKAALAYGGESLHLQDITPEWLCNYQAHLLVHQLLWNTVSTYMRMLRAVYNRAVDAGLTPYIPHQFKRVFTGRKTNHQRALEREEIRRMLSDQDESKQPDRDESGRVDESEETPACSRRDLRWACACLELMLRFHGMPFVDLAHLRKSDLQGGYLNLYRRKTGMPLSVRVDTRSMELLKRYMSHDDTSPYLLCFLDGTLERQEAYKDYQRLLHLLNMQLHLLARKRGVCGKVTSYSARHTWATVGKYCNIPIEVISEGLGHASITTTEGYMKSFGSERLEDANTVIINYIFKD